MIPLELKSKLLARNTALNLVGQGIPLIVAFVSIPFVIRGLGTERFGILTLAWVVFTYFNIFNFGLGRATIKFVAEALGKRDYERAVTVTWTTAVAQGILGFIGGVVLIGITPLLTDQILNIPINLIRETRIVFYLLALSLPLHLISGSFRGVLEAAQRFDIVNSVRVPYNSAHFLLPLVGLLLGWDLPGIIALLITSRVLTLIVYYWLCKNILPSLKQPSLHLKELRILMSFGGWITVSSFINPILIYLDRFMIGAILTMSAVAFYTAPYEMLTRLWIIPSALVATLYPAFSTLAGQNQWQRLRVLMISSVKYVLITLGIVVVILAVYSHEILNLWLGPEFARESALVLRILAIGILINSLSHGAHSLIQALGRPDLTAKFHLAELPLHIILMWWLVSAWGIAGAAIAWTVRVVVDALLLFIAGSRLSSLTLGSFMTLKIPQTVVLLIVVGLVTAGVVILPITIWLSLFFVVLIFVTAVTVTWRYILDRDERKQIAGLFRLRLAPSE